MTQKGPHQPQKLTGKRRQGELYEQALGEAVKKQFPHADIHLGVWFHWEDRLGSAWCSPDILVVEDDLLWVIEAKLGYTERAWKQLNLYSPLANYHFGARPTVRMQVTSHLGNTNRKKISVPRIYDFNEVFERDQEYYLMLWRK